MNIKDKPVILIVDDHEAFRDALCRALELRGWEAHAAPNAERALAIAKTNTLDLILVDLRMPGTSGLDLSKMFGSVDAEIATMVLTFYGSIAAAIKLHNLPASQPPSAVPSLAWVEREHIERVLADCGGNVSQAARLLGIHRRSLQRKLSKYPPKR